MTRVGNKRASENRIAIRRPAQQTSANTCDAREQAYDAPAHRSAAGEAFFHRRRRRRLVGERRLGRRGPVLDLVVVQPDTFQHPAGDRHSAAPPSPCSRCLNRHGEGVSAGKKTELSPTASGRPPARRGDESEERPNSSGRVGCCGRPDLWSSRCRGSCSTRFSGRPPVETQRPRQTGGCCCCSCRPRRCRRRRAPRGRWSLVGGLPVWTDTRSIQVFVSIHAGKASGKHTCSPAKRWQCQGAHRCCIDRPPP